MPSYSFHWHIVMVSVLMAVNRVQHVVSVASGGELRTDSGLVEQEHEVLLSSVKFFIIGRMHNSSRSVMLRQFV